MNPYDREDANMPAGRKVRQQAMLIIDGYKTMHEALFDAFIAGVEYGRKNPVEKK